MARGVDGARLATVTSIGSSLEGRDIDLVRVGSGPTVCWLIGRQHPGETMAEWWMKGLLQRLLDPTDSLARSLCTLATFYVVPNMNPDGTFKGYLRTNSSGANLNREWAPTGNHLAPTLQASPEVYCVLNMLERTGCDFFLDVHGDEQLPHIFFAGTQGVSNWSARLHELYCQLVEAQVRAFPAFQREHGYGNDKVGEANLAIAADAVAHRFDCLAVTLEMPFKDAFEQTEPMCGWSPLRCQQLGRSLLDALCTVLPQLRTPFPFAVQSPGAEEPVWAQPAYANPPWMECWHTEPSNSTCLWIARHGEKESESRPSNWLLMLTAPGIESIKQRAMQLKQLTVKPTSIVCSPFRRCIVTAALYADILGIATILVEPALCEVLTPSLGGRGLVSPPQWECSELQRFVAEVGAHATVDCSHAAVVPMAELRLACDDADRTEVDERVARVAKHIVNGCYGHCLLVTHGSPSYRLVRQLTPCKTFEEPAMGSVVKIERRPHATLGAWGEISRIFDSMPMPASS
jgi:broad specificity phosphatase PhoE